jgi:hypothetical protein
MNGDALIEALDLPGNSRVDQRVPKKLLLENVTATIADKRVINDGVEELHWLAALKPTTIGVPEYRDNAREYVEIAVLRLSLRVSNKAKRLVELVHRAVPYPLLLIPDAGGRPGISAVHKRRSLGEMGKTVLDGDVITAEWDAELNGQCWSAFRKALVLGKQPRTSLYSLYQGWLDTLLALQAARVTGAFAAAANPQDAALRREALQECARLDAEIARLHAAAAKEKQTSRRVELNLELKRAEAAHAAARVKL